MIREKVNLFLFFMRFKDGRHFIHYCCGDHSKMKDFSSQKVLEGVLNDFDQETLSKLDMSYEPDCARYVLSNITDEIIEEKINSLISDLGMERFK